MESTREAILAAAGHLFTGKGYERTTIADVAREAGVAVGSVYRHFTDKADLLYAVKVQSDQRFFDVFTLPEVTSGPYPDRIRAMMAAIFAVGSRHSGMLQLMGLPNQLVGDASKQRSDEPIQSAIKGFLDEAVAAGAFRPIDTEAAAVMSYGMVQSALRRCFETDGGTTQQRYVAALADALWRWVDPHGGSPRSG